MYCQSCGGEIQPGINYCNRCGASVSSAEVKEVPVPLDLATPVRWIASSVCLMFLAGLAIIFISLSGLLSWGLSRDAVMVIAFFSLATLLGIELSLIHLLSRLLGAAKESRPLTQLKQAKTRGPQHQAAPPQLIPPATDLYAGFAPSVTEHTTRAFDPAYRAPRADQ